MSGSYTKSINSTKNGSLAIYKERIYKDQLVEGSNTVKITGNAYFQSVFSGDAPFYKTGETTININVIPPGLLVVDLGINPQKVGVDEEYTVTNESFIPTDGTIKTNILEKSIKEII